MSRLNDDVDMLPKVRLDQMGGVKNDADMLLKVRIRQDE